MNAIALLHDPVQEKLHEEFNDLMEKVNLLICSAYAEAAKDAERAALQQFEFEIAEAVRQPHICEKLNGVRLALKRRYITDL